MVRRPVSERRPRWFAAIVIGLMPSLFVLGSSTASPTAGRDAKDVADRFADALAKGDRTSATALLQPDALIFESGEAEQSSADYARHHLAADIAFLAGMTRTVADRQASGDDHVQWVATRARISGQYKGRAVDLDSTETMVVTRTSAGWRISHIHWSSAPHRKDVHHAPP